MIADLKQMNKTVFAVLVTFHPDLGHLDALIDNLNLQVSQTIVVDNGSKPEALALLLKRAQLGSIKLITLGDNFGIAYAQNYGIKLAIAANADFVLLMDQDSLPCPDMVAELQRAAISLSDLGRPVAAVGPICAVAHEIPSTTIFLTFDHFPPTKCKCSNVSDQIPTDQLIASGMLIPASAFEVVGLMDEALFIDQVDMDWCLRARSKEMVLFGVCSAKLIHNIGLGVARIWFGRWRPVATHSPIRNYYFMRNSLVLMGRRHASQYWRLFILYFLTGWLLRTVFLPPRLVRIKLISKGFLHALLHRLGPL